MRYDEDAYLSGLLTAGARGWVTSFRAHWGLDSATAPQHVNQSDWHTAKNLDVLTAHIVTAARTLERSPAHPDLVLESYFEQHEEPLTEHPLFRQALEANLVSDLENELEAMSAHAVCLLAYLVSVRHERARAYLARVGSCYLRGLDTETIVMAGAVLDAALQDMFDDTVVRDSGVRCGRYVSLGNRIDYAVRIGALSEEQGEMAFRIAHERNKTVHVAPGTSVDVDDVLAALAEVLNALM